MGLFDAITQGVLGTADFIADQVQTAKQNQMNEKNFQLQQQALAYNQEQNEYLRGAQQTTWNREDNAVQRRVADLKAAGLSPTLAAGSAASSSAPISTGHVSAPQQSRERYNLDMADRMMSAITARKNIDNLDQQNQLLQATRNKTDAETLEAGARVNNLTLQGQRAAFDNDLLRTRYNMEFQSWAKSQGLSDQQMKEMESKINANNAAANLSAQKLLDDMYNYNYYHRIGQPTNTSGWMKEGGILGSTLFDLYSGMQKNSRPPKTPDVDPALQSRKRTHDLVRKYGNYKNFIGGN